MKTLRCVVLLGLCTSVAACAPLPPPTPPIAAPHPQATVHSIEVVSTRRPNDREEALFGARRNAELGYGRVRISVPPTHQTGQIEWPGRNPNAAETFAVTGFEAFENRRAFEAAMPPSAETVLFIHGFNNTAPEAAFQLAQIRHDFGITMPTVLFAWPSAAEVRGYLYDRDSILFSRSDLARTLLELTRARGRVLVVAHSMGGLLTMEALRQLSLEGDRETLRGISGVTLVSPDIDKDLFQRQAATIGTLPQPFVVFVAQTDRALRISGLLTGRQERLGNIASAEDIGDLPVTVIDFTTFGEERGLNHQVALNSPAAITLLRGVLDGRAEAVEALAPYVIVGAPPPRVVNR